MPEGFWHCWQRIPEHLSPVIVEIGPFPLGYYGLMYVVAFVVVYILSYYRIKTEETPYTPKYIENYLIWAAIGLILGARVGYVLFYNFEFFISRPLEIFLPFSFEGGFHFTGISGMSYHGGAIGGILATVIYSRKHKMNVWDLGDFLIPSVALAYTFGRLGNFINGELYGRPTDVPWGMYFPGDPLGELRHPSQLYEAFFEGIFLFAVLWSLRKKRPFSGFHFSLYLIGYGLVRFFIEFVREPDAHLGTVMGPFSMGQVLCAAMVAAGCIIAVLRRGAAPAR